MKKSINYFCVIPSSLYVSAMILCLSCGSSIKESQDFAPNRAPEFGEVTVALAGTGQEIDRDNLIPGMVLKISVAVRDPEGKSLTYGVSSDFGSVKSLEPSDTGCSFVFITSDTRNIDDVYINITATDEKKAVALKRYPLGKGKTAADISLSVTGKNPCGATNSTSLTFTSSVTGYFSAICDNDASGFTSMPEGGFIYKYGTAKADSVFKAKGTLCSDSSVYLQLKKTNAVNTIWAVFDDGVNPVLAVKCEVTEDGDLPVPVISPANAEENVLINPAAAISLTFGKDIDLSTVEGAVTVTNLSNTYKASVAASSAKSVQYTVTGLSENTTYTVTVSGIKDTSGNTMMPVSSSFKSTFKSSVWVPSFISIAKGESLNFSASVSAPFPAGAVFSGWKSDNPSVTTVLETSSTTTASYMSSLVTVTGVSSGSATITVTYNHSTLSFPVYVCEVTSVAASSTVSSIVRTDGKLYTCGSPSSYIGRLSDSSSTSSSYYGKVVYAAPVIGYPVYGSISSIVSGSAHTLFSAGGNLYGFGSNTYNNGKEFGSLGLGSNTTAQYPMKIDINVNTDPDKVTCVSSHDYFSLIVNDGILYACGQNDSGQLGMGVTGGSYSVPTIVSSLSGKSVSAAAAGCNHALAIVNGELWVCGLGSAGQLGLGSGTTSATVFTKVPGFSNVTMVAAGSNSSFFVDSGNLYAMGENTAAQLGIGTTANTFVPVKISSLSGVTSVSSNGSYSLFAAGGTLYTCGTSSSNGLLADGNVSSVKTSPQQISLDNDGASLGFVSSVSAGSTHALMVCGGKAYGWGLDNGRLGQGSDLGTVTKPLVIPIPKTAVFQSYTAW
jgi:alpha-tubulin suppressor-like RCC1 family protein